MDQIVVSLLPFIIGSALVPLQIIILILLLTGEKQGPLKATAFVLGMTMTRLIQGLLFGLALTGGSGDPADAGGITWVKSTALLLLGILLLSTAYRKWAKEPDPDAPPPKWMTMLDGITPVRAFLFGAGFILIAVKLWVFTLGAISVIGEAQPGQREAIVAFLWYVLLAQSLLILPILIRLLVPSQAGRLLKAFGDWLERYNRQIVIIVSLIFGLYFLYKGVTGFF
ncbi:MAG: GAP family protein [Anaerolineae bacterium]|nr:GAP family protein [Promineifilum sp.]MCZ2114990.1 GAP family protein [Anaerolineae bacterium]HNS39522.1 GAP family protein [Promineifilum sp.]